MRFLTPLIAMFWVAPALADVDIFDLDGNVIHTVIGQNTLEGADLSNLDLRNANLAGVKMNDANFSGANFSGADLSNAKAKRVDITDINWIDANLSGANFADATSDGSRFYRTNMTGTQMRRVSLPRTKFIGCDMTGFIATDADLSDSKFLPSPDNPPVPTVTPLWKALSVDLSGAVMKDLDLTGANFQSANLTGTNFTRSNLSGVKLTNADITAAVFKDVTLSPTTLLIGAKVVATRDWTEESNSDDIRRLWKALEASGSLGGFNAAWQSLYASKQLAAPPPPLP